ncbi:uncharacterized [Tachysurus ichikawai]
MPTLGLALGFCRPETATSTGGVKILVLLVFTGGVGRVREQFGSASHTLMRNTVVDYFPVTTLSTNKEGQDVTCIVDKKWE